jgi:hypothetical protein
MKYYRGVEDYQGGTWGMYVQSISDWRKSAMCWCDSDGNYELYNALKYYKIKNKDLIEFIEEFWTIKLVPTSKELYLKYKDKIYIEDYEEDYWNYKESECKC